MVYKDLIALAVMFLTKKQSPRKLPFEDPIVLAVKPILSAKGSKNIGALKSNENILVQPKVVKNIFVASSFRLPNLNFQNPIRHPVPIDNDAGKRQGDNGSGDQGQRNPSCGVADFKGLGVTKFV